ncbi:MAG: DoxX family protein [Verrucomicrobiia bacterium]
MEQTPVIQTSPPEVEVVSRKTLWIGRIISAVPVVMLLLSAAVKFAKPPSVVEGFAHLGLPERLALDLGVLELLCTVLYVFPRTAVLGAILLTGYLGGAILAHLRVGDAFIGPIAFGVMVWAGLFLRDTRLRTLIPLRE